jgi:parallel beta-helix repeat protein
MKRTRPRAGLTIRAATAIQPGRYSLGGDRSASVVTVTGAGFALDFTGVELQGKKQPQHSYKGVGLHLKRCKQVVVAGLTVSGYHNGIRLEDCEDVTIIDCNADGNHRRKFYSKPTTYDKRDFLNIFDYKVWSRYGAGIYLKNCRNCRVLRCTARQQLNGIILDNCQGCLVQANDCSNNKGWGIRLYASSASEIVGNRCVRCVSGESAHYSHGNDSAGICICHGCDGNLVSRNDLRGSGDGFFMTADLGTEESNDNIIAGNDGSHSPHNAFESTFCLRNHFYNNIANYSGYGFWMGFSRENRIIDNEVLGNRAAGIAIEHGRDNVLAGNHIEHCREQGILLFRRKPDGPRSERYLIEGNHFEWNGVGIELRETSHVRVYRNEFVGTGERWVADKRRKTNVFEGNLAL